jgi:hypothetical protein
MSDEDASASRMIEPVHQSVAKLLGAQQTFQAPRYQRNYAWGSNEIAAFLRDLDGCLRLRMQMGKTRHHFFGGLVTVNAKVPGSSRTNLEVVDGQQRLATFAMLISQLKRTLKSIADSLPEGNPLKGALEVRAKGLTTTYEVLVDEIKLRNVEVPRIQLSAPDQPFFAALLKGEAPESDRKSHDLLAAAYAQIGEYLTDLVDEAEDIEGKAERLHQVHEILRNDWTIIHMAAASKSDAYMLFQVLNDRGVGLTEGELLRSATLEALEDAAGVDVINDVEGYWNAMLSGDVVVVRNAFGWLYASQLGSWPSPATMLDDYLAAFFPAMNRDGKLDAKGVQDLAGQVRALAEDFERVRAIVGGAWPFPGSGATAWRKNRLRLLTVHLRYTDCVSLLVAACQLPAQSFADLVILLEHFAFRYGICGDGPANKARDVFNRHAVDIRRDASNFKMGDLKADLAKLLLAHVPDETFRSQLAQLRYAQSDLSNAPLKYLLLTLEDYFRWYDDNPQGQPVCRDEVRLLDFETGTIEHIYAQNADAPDLALDALVNTLGNLTFLSGPENDRAGSKPFAEKRAYFAESTSHMNRRIAEHETWTVEVIEARAAELVTMALRVFAIPKIKTKPAVRPTPRAAPVAPPHDEVVDVQSP